MQLRALTIAAGAAAATTASAQTTIPLTPALTDIQTWNPIAHNPSAPAGNDWIPQSDARGFIFGLRWRWQNNTMPDGTGDTIIPTPVPVFDPAVPGITHAYQFPEARAATQNADGTGNRGTVWENQAPIMEIGASFEIWFKLEDTQGTHVIWEIGAPNKGVAFSIDGNELVYSTSANDGAGGNSYAISHRQAVQAGVWYQAAIAISYIDFTVASYLNGTQVNTQAIPVPSINYRWSSANPAGLGTLGSDPMFPNVGVGGDPIPAANFTDFDGMIAMHRFYRNFDLFPDDINANYLAITDQQAAIRRADRNGDSTIDSSDYSAVLNLSAASTSGPHSGGFLPFPSDPRGGVHTGDPEQDETFLGDFAWDRNSGFNNQEPSFVYESGPNVLVPTTVNDPSIPSVRRAFELDGTQGLRGPKYNENSISTGNSLRTQAWIRIDDLVGNHCLFEIGGTTGYGMYISGDEILGAVGSNAGANNEVTVSSGTGVLTTGWHLFEMVVRRFNVNSIPLGKGIEIYMDGQLLASLNDQPGMDGILNTAETPSADDIVVFEAGTSFVGGNQSGLGTISGVARVPNGFVAGDFTPLTGAVGPFKIIQIQPAPSVIAAEYAADVGQDTLNVRNDVNADGEANIFDLIESLKVLDAAK
ncbi:MAG: hypothetical protein AAFR38_14245 [Planctomycetota bacterium]